MYTDSLKLFSVHKRIKFQIIYHNIVQQFISLLIVINGAYLRNA